MAVQKKPTDKIPKNIKGASGTANKPRNPSKGTQSVRKADCKASFLLVQLAMPTNKQEMEWMSRLR